MQLSTLKPGHARKHKKAIGRGGKRGTTSGKGTKGQKSRAGATVRPGFRGGDNRIWQLFPKMRGAGKKPGNNKPHHKHRFFMLRHAKPAEVNLWSLSVFTEGDTVSPETLATKGLIPAGSKVVKVLGGGVITKRLTFNGVRMSKSAHTKIEAAGGSVAA